MDELIDKVISLFIEGDGDDEFTRGYNFAVEEYREKVKQILSTTEVSRMVDLINRDHAAQAIEAYLCNQCDHDTDCDPECIACPHLDGAEILKSVSTVNRIPIDSLILENSNYCEFCDGVSFSEEPFTVITPKDKKVDCLFRFCPNCGRKLSEGE